MIKAIIFDCFGVIITDALQVICQELADKDPEACRQVHDLIKANNRGMITPEESNQQIAAILGVSVEEFRTKIADGEVKDKRVLNYAAELRSQYKTAMLSNIAHNSLDRRFAEHELEKSFDEVVVSGDIGFAKPEAQAYEITADRLGVRLDECIFTDDRESFCEAARTVGMQAILYESFPQFKQDLEEMTKGGGL
jgi:HAD superfamily hydrolase (TIGR01509 family)